MIKSLLYTLAAVALCVGLFLFSDLYVNGQFADMSAAIETLYHKVEDGTANREDAVAVRSLWADKKQKLHVWIPHNDISYVDYWLSETCGLVYRQEYDLALGKVEVLREIVQNLPASYTLRLENVF